MIVDVPLGSLPEEAPPAAAAASPLQPAGSAGELAETPNVRELISRAGKMFLGELGEPVASGDGPAVTETTNSLIIDVVDAIKELFTTSASEIKSSCGGLTEKQARGYLLADLLGRFELVFDGHAGDAGNCAGTQAKAAKDEATLAAKAARKRAAPGERDSAAAKRRAPMFSRRRTTSGCRVGPRL